MATSTRSVALEWVDAHADLIVDIHPQLWGHPEVGLQEYVASKLLADTLEAHGFVVAAPARQTRRRASAVGLRLTTP